MEMIDLTEIERQHQKLTNMLGRLSDAAKNHEPRDVVYRIIDDVIAYTESHFSIEEQLMSQTSFPEIELHKKHHKQLIREAHRLREKYDYVGEDMFSEWFDHWYFTNFLAHIRYADKPIDDHIAQSAAKK